MSISKLDEVLLALRGLKNVDYLNNTSECKVIGCQVKGLGSGQHKGKLVVMTRKYDNYYTLMCEEHAILEWLSWKKDEL